MDKPEWALVQNWKTGKSVFDRFMSLCIPEPNSGCWLWIGNIEREHKPYGRMTVNGKSVQAHRLSYEIFNGELGDMLACHRCDNPNCVNPDHIFAGTPRDNSRDRNRKGRHAHGEKTGNRKLSIEAVLMIRDAPGEYRDIGRKFNIHNSVVSQIKNGKAWVEAIRLHEERGHDRKS